MKRLASRDNPRFKTIRKLCQSGRERRKTGLVLLDGMHLVESHLSHHGEPEEIIVSESGLLHPEVAAFVERYSGRGAIAVFSDALFAELAVVDTPSGIMAIAKRPAGLHAIDQEADAVALDGIQDPGNLGSILRSAAAAGFRQILLSSDCAQAWSPKTLRAAMGAHFQLDIHENCDLPAFLGGYRGQAVLTALEGADDLYSVDLAGQVVWIFGNEGQGVREEVAQAVALKVRIPMPGEMESLNVAAAAAVCLFKTVRQRKMVR